MWVLDARRALEGATKPHLCVETRIEKIYGSYNDGVGESYETLRFVSAVTDRALLRPRVGSCENIHVVQPSYSRFDRPIIIR